MEFEKFRGEKKIPRLRPREGRMGEDHAEAFKVSPRLSAESKEDKELPPRSTVIWSHSEVVDQMPERHVTKDKDDSRYRAGQRARDPDELRFGGQMLRTNIPFFLSGKQNETKQKWAQGGRPPEADSVTLCGQEG